MASDRGVWKIVCETGLMNFVNDWTAATEHWRANRHVAASKPKTGAVFLQQQSLCFSVQTVSHLKIHPGAQPRLQSWGSSSLVWDITTLLQKNRQVYPV